MNAVTIVDFHYPGLEEVEHLASHVTGFKVNSHRMEVYGTCPTCAGCQSKLKNIQQAFCGRFAGCFFILISFWIHCCFLFGRLYVTSNSLPSNDGSSVSGSRQ